MRRKCPFCKSHDFDEVGFSDVELTATSAFVIDLVAYRCLDCGELHPRSTRTVAIREDRLLFEGRAAREAVAA